MIADYILCENIEEHNKEPEYQKILEIIDTCSKQGVFDLGRGYCSTTSLVFQSLLKRC